jgi:peptide/nickel transport system permease protein
MTAEPAIAQPARPSARSWIAGLDKGAACGLVILALTILVAIFGPWLAPHSPRQILGNPFLPPGEFLLGTDALGRDVLSRLIVGAHLTVLTAVSATALGFILGMLLGMPPAVVRGRYDDIATWVIDLLLSFPPLLLALLIISALGADLMVLICTVALIHMPRVARVSRAAALGVAALTFVDVSRARGEGLPSILWRDVLPNCLRLLGAEFGLRLTYSILTIAGLSFLGLGIQPPDADWGSMVRENLTALQLGSYAATLAPALAIGILSIAVNLIVDWTGRRSTQSIPQELRS